jgi:hypothetical protein
MRSIRLLTPLARRSDRRREVGYRSETLELRQRELGPLLVVARLDEEDAEVRQRDPRRRGEVAEDAAGDARADPVDTEQSDRQQHDRVEQHDRRQSRYEVRPGDSRHRCQQDRPAVADVRRRQVSVGK